MDRKAIKEVFEELAQEYCQLSNAFCCEWATKTKDWDEDEKRCKEYIDSLRNKLNKALKKK